MGAVNLVKVEPRLLGNVRDEVRLMPMTAAMHTALGTIQTLGLLAASGDEAWLWHMIP